MSRRQYLSVIIPTCHRNDLLAQCLDRLAPGEQTLPAEQYEVIVSDDGSQSTAREMLRCHYPWAKWLAGPRRGPAANRNCGAKAACGGWLVFTDDDCLPEPDWLTSFFESVNDAVIALEGAIAPLGDPNQDMAQCPINLEGECFWSANIAVRRDVFQRIGGFDENYLIAAQEDQDLYLRLLPLGKIKFVTHAIVLHPVRKVTALEEWIAIFPRSRNWIYHVKKHGAQLGQTTLFSILYASLSTHLRIALQHLRAGRVKSAFVGAISIFAVIVLLPYYYYRNLITKSSCYN